MPPFSLPDTLAAWSDADFSSVLEAELAALPAGVLPLVRAMSQGSAPGSSPIRITLLGRDSDGEKKVLNVGVFFTSIIAGCSCADDPTPVEELPEYAQLCLIIDPVSGAAEVVLNED